MRLGDRRQPQAGEVGVAQLQGFGGEPEHGAVGTREALCNQGVQEAAGGCPREASDLSYLGECLAWASAVEGADNRKSAAQALDELYVTLFHECEPTS